MTEVLHYIALVSYGEMGWGQLWDDMKLDSNLVGRFKSMYSSTHVLIIHALVFAVQSCLSYAFVPLISFGSTDRWH